MKKTLLAVFVLALGAGVASAEEWKGVSVIDGNCLEKVKADPDKHPRSCAIQCAKGGYGVLTSDGKYLKFDAAGNEKALAALKESKKADHLRADVTGDRDGDTIKVSSFTLK
jgi:hypothetical protein